MALLTTDKAKSNITDLVEVVPISHSTSILDAIDKRIKDLKRKFDSDVELSEEECQTLGFIHFCEHRNREIYEMYSFEALDLFESIQYYSVDKV